MKLRKVFHQVTALALALVMLFSMSSITYAAPTAEKDTLNYVSIGASQTNGYGMRNYLNKEAYEVPTPIAKATANIYGYEQVVEDAYPNLVKEALESQTGKNVELHQLAISSMRAEEVHILLDNEYEGDAYSKWRFTAGQNWFAQAHKDGLAGLRKEYQDYVANADVISLDIGVNNFGVYLINRIASGMFDSDLSKVFTEEELAAFNEAKQEVANFLRAKVGESDSKSLYELTETLTYAYVGFTKHFDAVVKHIYEANPDVQLVVVGLPNMMQGVMAEVDGMSLPFGEVYGKVIDMANFYTSSLSPYADSYVYAYVGSDGSAETFLADIAAYTGNPADLSVNIKDCFDIYDNDMYIKCRVQALAYTYGLDILQAVYGADVMPTPANDSDEEMIKCVMAFQKFINDQKNEFKDIAVPAEMKAAAVQQLNTLYGLYETVLNEAYDITATILQYGANCNKIDLTALSDGDAYSAAQKEVLGYLMSSIEQAANVLDPNYKGFEVNKELFENNPLATTILTMGVRFDLGNSFFAHPNENGHIEIKNAIISALKNGTAGKDVAAEEIAEAIDKLSVYLAENNPELWAALKPTFKEIDSAEELKNVVENLSKGDIPATYYISEDSYLVSLGDSAVTGYGINKSAKTKAFPYLTAKAIGLDTAKQYKQLGNDMFRADELNYILGGTDKLDEYGTKAILPKINVESVRKQYIDEIKKSDIITLAFDNNFSQFMQTQISNSTPYELDWVGYLGEEGAAYVEDLLADVADSMVGSVGSSMASMADKLVMAVECYVYGYVGYALSCPSIVSAIHDINPKTEVVIVGMHNPLEGLQISGMDLGSYMVDLIDIVNSYTQLYAAIAANTIYVDAPEVETILESQSSNNSSLSLMVFVSNMIGGSKNLHASEKGHEYIKDQIMNAITVSTEPPKTVEFTDVKEGAYYYDPVMWAVENGITSGKTETTFGPNEGCTRAQAVTFMWRAAGCPEPKTTVNPFTDVKTGAYYYKAVLWASENGITSGKTETQFAPNATCTRAQIVTFLWRAAGEPTIAASNPFTDVRANAYYYNAVMWAVESGITSGKTADQFAPNAECTRAQIVTFLYRAQ